MRTLGMMIGLLAFFLMPLGCDAQTNSKEDKSTTLKASESAAVYYFHYTRRCKTCNEVESQTQEALQELYPQQMKAGKITFASINLEEKDGKATADKVGAKGQALLIVKGKESIDITDKAFMYVTTSPAKLKQELEKAIGIH